MLNIRKKRIIVFSMLWFLLITNIIFFQVIYSHASKFNFPDCNISLKYSKKWIPEEVGNLNPSINYIARFSDKNNNSTLISLIVYNITNSPITSVKELEERENRIISQIGIIKKSTIIKVDDKKAHKVIYNYSSPSVLDINPKIMEVNFLFLQYKYKIKFIVFDENNFDKNIKKFKKVIKSVNIDRNKSNIDYKNCF